MSAAHTCTKQRQSLGRYIYVCMYVYTTGPSCMESPARQSCPPSPVRNREKRRRVRMGTEGRHGGLSATGAPLPSVLGCVLRTIV